MKYVSLKCLMRAYARKAKEHGRYKRLLPGSFYQPGRPSLMFQITSHLEHREEGEQLVKTIQPCWSEIFGLSMRAIPPSLNVFPILELEWCRETEQITEEEFQVLEQVAYGVLLNLLAQDLGRDIYNAGFTKKDISIHGYIFVSVHCCVSFPGDFLNRITAAGVPSPASRAFRFRMVGFT